MIPIGIVGTVLNGVHPEMKVQVVDDAAATGGFLILTWWPGSGGLGAEGVFDDWVESLVALQEYWVERGLQVRWAI